MRAAAAALLVALGLALALALAGCAGAPPAGLGLHHGALAPCPATPNCVSSDATDPEQRVAAFELAAPPPVAWHALRLAVESLPRTLVVAQTDEYLHAECTSALFRFVDDLELHRLPDGRTLAVRSASRLGRSDLGVNRRRVEALRARLVADGIVR